MLLHPYRTARLRVDRGHTLTVAPVSPLPADRGRRRGRTVRQLPALVPLYPLLARLVVTTSAARAVISSRR
jgi:hypothetical protein